MRIRFSHIVLFFLVALAAGVFFLTSRTGRDVGPQAYTDGLNPPFQEPLDQAPVIELETEDLDVGVIPNDRDTLRKVRVFNRGKSVLHVHDVLTSCALCTEGFFESGKEYIPPGDYRDMNIRIHPNGIHGFTAVKTLSLLNNDPRRPKTLLVVRMAVNPEFELIPETFNFGEIQKGEGARTTVLFRTLTNAPLRVKGITMNSEGAAAILSSYLTFKIEDVEPSLWQAPEKPEYTLNAALAPGAPAGPFTATALIETDLQRFSIYAASLSGTVQAPYRIEYDQPGPTLVLREQTPQSVVTIAMREPGNVSAETQEDAAVVVQLEEASPILWKAVVKPVPGARRGIYQDTATLKIICGEHVYEEPVSIRIYAYGT